MKRPPCFPSTLTDLLEMTAWAAGEDTGVSSQALFAFMTGLPTRDRETGYSFTAPADLDDFGRCHRLVERFPQFRAHLAALARDNGASDAWKRVVRHWKRLTFLLATYANASTHETRANAWREATSLIDGRKRS